VRLNCDIQKWTKMHKFFLVISFLVLSSPLPAFAASEAPSPYAEKKLKETFEKIKVDANQGRAEFQFYLATLYRDGKGTEQSALKELYWYQQAAKQGYRPAIFNLGAMYFEGNGIERDVETGLTYLHWAHSLEYPPATEALGRIYVHGKNGAKKDLKKGLTYLEKCANEGMPNSLYLLAHAYLKGIGVEENEFKGVELLYKAAKRGQERAKDEIMKIENGLGMSVDEYLQQGRE